MQTRPFKSWKLLVVKCKLQVSTTKSRLRRCSSQFCSQMNNYNFATYGDLKLKIVCNKVKASWNKLGLKIVH